MIQIDLLPVTDNDTVFLQRLYVSTRQQEMAMAGLAADQATAFLHSQFNAQRLHYRQYYPQAQCDVISCDGVPAGRLYVDRSGDEIRIVDIALLPEYRGRGIGSRLLQGILAEAREAGLAVSLHVDKLNPALHWYRRLGFVTLEERGMYDFMRYSSAGSDESITIEHAG
ncbi:GNAT family N-acetyltransferase [uncultured Gilvimarinus sp.]|uniref:GNAT family N-acetyltransferase n=1 Tax=uncultured Gilvimarinus sp. TaxID=1689143 RepID=UPI0030ED67E9|tara:strand:+ start:817 stop:1323 length:507 start_codon:yes stop_codon:yes gene_type:complete